MSTESSRTAVRCAHNIIETANLHGLNRLIPKDTDWAVNILEQAFFTNPLLNFYYGDAIEKPGKLNWFFRVTVRLAALFGDCFLTTDKDGVLMMLPPDQANMTIDKMVRSGLWTAPFKMGWASFVRMMTFMDFAEKEHKAATSSDHYYIMTEGVLPER